MPTIQTHAPTSTRDQGPCRALWPWTAGGCRCQVTCDPRRVGPCSSDRGDIRMRPHPRQPGVLPIITQPRVTMCGSYRGRHRRDGDVVAEGAQVAAGPVPTKATTGFK